MKTRTDDFIKRLLSEGASLEVWSEEHAHDLHRAEAIAATLRRHFSLRHQSRAPYLYRYLASSLENSERGGEILSAVLALEQQSGKDNPVGLIGCRFVAAKRD